ncbi:C4-dicarboxylate ABC transporter substrate-binding protein OS=Streptomyces fumanus OX=67302 GN=GCM10018772_67320 PE=4 SV=1 [Streptomyces fumanus]
MRLRTPLALLGAAVLVLVGPPLLDTGGGTGTGTQIPGLRLMVPNTPGGGYGITARTAAKDAEDAGLTHSIEVFNLPGAGGTVGLSRLVGEHGNGRLAMSMGLGVVGAICAPTTRPGRSPTPRRSPGWPRRGCRGGRQGLPVPDDGDLVGAWRKDPGGLPVGGGSSPGGPTTSRRC